MAKAIRTAAIVVGVVALAATGIGAVAAAGTALAATAATVASVATIAGAALSVASLAIGAPKASLGGTATKFTIDKESGIPYMIGRTLSAGRVVHRQYHGAKNAFETWVSAHSLGPIKSLGPLLVDKVAQSFAGNGAALGSFAGFMWLATQLGACPEAAALPVFNGPVPGWSSSSKLSGLAADLWCLKYDTKNKKWPNGVPQRARVGEGVYVYDPRQDSTYPGGSGACRIGQEDTYVWSENPALHTLTYAFGRYQNGMLVAGGGLGVKGIDLARFVDWANVCDANGWKAGGVMFTDADNDWDICKAIAQAGGGEIFPVGGLLTCTFSAPRVSIGTISSTDLIGEADVPASASRRLRRNIVIPKVRLESHGWEMVPLDAVEIPVYIAADGGRRPKEVTLALVQEKDQGVELALYEVMNARELDGIVLPCKIYAIGYLPGDCVTVDVPEVNLVGRDVIIRQRGLSMGDLGVTLTCRSETASKHAFVLGKTGTPPPTPDLSIPDLDLSAPAAGDWTLAGATFTANGVSIPALVATGAVNDPNADGVVFDYRPYVLGADPDAGWSAASVEDVGTTRREFGTVTPGTQYEVGVRYRIRGVTTARQILGPVTAGQFSTARGAYKLDYYNPGAPASSTSSAIVVVAFTAVRDDGQSVSLRASASGEMTGLTEDVEHVVFWHYPTETYSAVPSANAAAQVASSDYVIVRVFRTAKADGTYTNPTPPPGDGGGGGGGIYPSQPIP